MNESLNSGLNYTKSTQLKYTLLSYVDEDYVKNVDTRISLLDFVFVLFGTSISSKENQ